jgi:NitT/TauT family transport system ATP-binding protein
MSHLSVTAGFLPLIDAAPLIVARELAFAEEEGLNLTLRRAPSWSALRDLLTFGQVDAASMLSPIPVAQALGLGGGAAALDALMVTSLGGEMIAFPDHIVRQLGGADRTDPVALRSALPMPLRIGVPFPFSIHAELLYRWLGEKITVQTVPPPLLPDAMAAGELDLFIVGEPWATGAADRGIASLLLPGTAIWRAPPDKVLAMRRDRAEADPDLTGRLMRAVWRACRWLRLRENRITAAEIMARSPYLDLPPDLIERAMDSGVEFFEGCATFPWRSQAEWIGARLARRHGLDVMQARHAAQAVFRSDLYRLHLRPAGADLPAASSRLEGAVSEPGLHPAAAGRVLLLPDRFFDGAVFDPDTA